MNGIAVVLELIKNLLINKNMIAKIQPRQILNRTVLESKVQVNKLISFISPPPNKYLSLIDSDIITMSMRIPKTQIDLRKFKAISWTGQTTTLIPETINHAAMISLLFTFCQRKSVYEKRKNGKK